MKKFISMVMAAAMVVSLVPATAFAKTGTLVATGEARIEGKVEEGKDFNFGKGTGVIDRANAAEVIIKLDKVSANMTDGTIEQEIKYTLDGAKFVALDGSAVTDAAVLGSLAVNGVKVGTDGVLADNEAGTGHKALNVAVAIGEDADEVTFTFTGVTGCLLEDDVISFDLMSKMDHTNVGAKAYVEVETDIEGASTEEALLYAEVVGQKLDVTVSGKPVEVAEEEIVTLKDVTIKSKVDAFENGAEIRVRITGGFEFLNVATTGILDNNGDAQASNIVITGTNNVSIEDIEDDEFIIKTGAADITEIVLKNLKVEAVSADAGEVGTIVVSCRNFDGDEDEAVKVIAEEVIMSVDEDEDVPVMYSGTDVLETGLTSKNSHKALEVTIKESVVGAWDTVDKWTLSLPEGVYVTDGATVVENAELTWKNATTADAAFKDAYADGDFENFEFGRRSFTVATGKKAEIKFTLELVAEPEFEGPVTLTLSGDAFEGEAEVVIAEFVRPYTVEAQQNDMIIDYKETPVPSAIVVTEAEEGLWKDTTDVTTFDFAIEGNHIVVEDAGDVTVNETSDMDVKQVSTGFYVKEESHDEAGVVTLDGILLYMERNVPAGAYDLLLTTSMSDSFMAEEVFGASVGTTTIGGTAYPTEDVRFVYYDNDAEYFETVKEGFVNVITAGRDKDDASFTTKVVVPVGESYLIAGEEKVTLDVPAYINAAGYTMLPVRAVATALGIDTNNVLWSQTAKQVTILYGQRIITMTVGQSVIYVNGSAIPAAAAVEVVDGRAFLGLRDLANALGVTDIAYDAATKTATLN